VLLVLVLLLCFELIFIPLYSALEYALLGSLEAITETSKISLDYVIERGLEVSSNVSSRTAIKNKIVEYKQGKVTLDELKSFTSPKYNDGITSIKDVVYSVRTVDGKTIAQYGSSPIDVTIFIFGNELTYKIIVDGEKKYFIGYSPIKAYGVTLGSDILVFDLAKDLERMSLPNIKTDIVNRNEMNSFVLNETINSIIKESTAKDSEVSLNFFHKISEDAYFRISTSKELYYTNINRSIKDTTIYICIGFAVLFVGINFIIILLAKNKITSLGKSEEKYKSKAYTDTLTGAFTRLYLNKWLKKVNNSNCSIVMIDINDFKVINDIYGHQTGDETLKEIVATIKSEIRSGDFIVRYGGDEFVIIFDGASKAVTTTIMDRINSILGQSMTFEFTFSLSYGVVELIDKNDFEEILRLADAEMYEMKRKYKLNPLNNMKVNRD